MRLRERPLTGRLRTSIVGVQVLTSRAARFPNARIGGTLRVSKLDCAGCLVDREACVDKLEAKPLENDVGVFNFMGFAKKPVAQRQDLAQSLVMQGCCWLCHNEAVGRSIFGPNLTLSKGYALR